MDFDEIKEKISHVRDKLKELKELASIIETEDWPKRVEDGEFGKRTSVYEVNNDLAERIEGLRKEIEGNLPTGYRVGADLIRHLSWLQVVDLRDIYYRDIDVEYRNLSQFEDRLRLVEYLAGLHPRVAKVKSLVLEGSLDEALKAVFTSLEARIRSVTDEAADVSIKAVIAKAFKSGALEYTKPEYNEGARDYLIGVMCYFRSRIVHHELPPSRGTIEAALSLFAVAHEAYELLERCIPQDDDVL